MNYLTDVLIIDDQLTEANDLQELFVKNGYFPVIVKPEWITNNFSLSPQIVCCDINLLGGNNDEANFKLIQGTLKKIFKQPTTYIFIAWTSHKSKLQALKEHLSADVSLVQPVGFLSMGKNEFRSKPNKLKILINNMLKENIGLKICLIWNSIIRHANNMSLITLTDLSLSTGVELQQLLYDLAAQNFGVNVPKNETASLIIPINLILKDNVEKNIALSPFSKELSKIFKNMGPTAKKSISEDLKAKVNAIMHISMQNGVNKIVPGDFIKIDASFLRKKLKYPKLNIIDLLGKTIKTSANESQVILGMVEITADCDFSNCKTAGVHKFAFAYLVPLSIFSKADEYHNKNTNITVEYQSQKYQMIVDCRFILAFKANELKNQKLFNIRDGLLTSYRKNIYDHNSRIGTISF